MCHPRTAHYRHSHLRLHGSAAPAAILFRPFHRLGMHDAVQSSDGTWEAQPLSAKYARHAEDSVPRTRSFCLIGADNTHMFGLFHFERGCRGNFKVHLGEAAFDRHHHSKTNSAALLRDG